MKKILLLPVILLLFCASAFAGLDLNGTSQYLTAPWAPSVQPLTFMMWVRQPADSRLGTQCLMSVSDQSENLAFNALQITETKTRSISFVPYAETSGVNIFRDATVHHLVAVFSVTGQRLYVDGAEVTAAWTAGSAALDTVAIGTEIRTGAPTEYFDGVVEHVAVWNTALTASEVGELYNLTTSPADMQAANLVAYFPFIDSLSDQAGDLAWTPTGLSSPTYISLGVTYPSGGTTWTVTYDANSATSGNAPTDANSPYEDNATVTVIGNTGTLARTGYTWTGWNTSAAGTGTHYDADDTFNITENLTLYAEWGAVNPTLTYNANNATSGTAPTDPSSPYNDGTTVTVLGNTGGLIRTGYSFDGWNTAANGTGTHYAAGATFAISADTTLYAEWGATYQYRTINHLNYDPTSRSNAEITAAAALRVYFEHASTGQDIVGDSDADSSTGQNYNSTGNCGLALLYALDNRYLCNRESYSSSNDYTWFGANTGLQSNARGNPTPAIKLSGFLGMSANLAGAVDVAMFKFCWIDVWMETTGYVSDGVAFAASMISDINAFEAANPDLVHVYWTMPLQSTASYAARQAFNEAIRSHCLTNGKWLLDIAAIQSHNDAGELQLDGSSREIMTASYAAADGGHLSEAGRTKLARAYWSLLVSIAAEMTPANDTGGAGLMIGF